MSAATNTVAGRPPGTPPIVLLKGICKYFPGVVANQSIDLEVLDRKSVV